MNNNQNSSTGWKMKKLGEIGEISGGSTPSTKIPKYWNGDIPWLTPSEVTKNESLFITETERNITLEGVKSCGTSVLPAGTVMMTSRATIGNPIINSVPMATNQGFINVKTNDEVSNEYLAYWIMHNKHLLESMASGVTFKELSKSNFKNIVFNYPPKDKQSAVVNALNTVRFTLDIRKQELSLEMERKRALMDFLFNKERKGEDWKIKKLGEIANVTSGGTPSRNKPEYWNGSIPWVKTGEIRYQLIIDTKEYITELGLKNSSARILPKGTLLMAMYGQGITRGRVAILGIDAAINQACAAISVKEEVRTEYLFQYLTFAYEKIRNLGHGANQQNLNAILIKSIDIPFPSIDEQVEIAELLGVCDVKMFCLEKEIKLLNELFSTLLEELITGNLNLDRLVN